MKKLFASAALCQALGFGQAQGVSGAFTAQQSAYKAERMLGQPMQALSVSASYLLAQAPPLKSAAWAGPNVPCGTYASGPDLMPLDGANNWNTLTSSPGAGVWNGANASIRRVCITHQGNAGYPMYAVVGHSGPNGDHVSPYMISLDSKCLSFDSAPVVFTTGEYFDIHAGCSAGSHHVILQIWYTQP